MLISCGVCYALVCSQKINFDTDGTTMFLCSYAEFSF